MKVNTKSTMTFKQKQKKDKKRKKTKEEIRIQEEVEKDRWFSKNVKRNKQFCLNEIQKAESQSIEGL